MRILLLGFIVLQTGCVGLDLGDAPFLCNSGYPQCPEGYHCLAMGQDDYCVKEGAKVGEAGTPTSDSGAKGPGTFDGLVSGRDTAMADIPKPQKPDIKMSMDAHGKPDVLPWKGCKTNNDCKTTTYKCCCKVFLLPTMVCLPVCPDPYCI